MRSETRRIFRAVFSALFIGLGVNFFIALFLDRRTILAALSTVDVQVILVPFLCFFAIYLVDTLRLALVLRQFGRRIRLKDGFLNGVFTVLFSNLTPMAGGGQPFQIYHLTTLGVDSKKATNLVLSRHVEYMMTSLGVFLFGLPTVLRLAGASRVGGGILYSGLTVSTGFGILFLVVLIRPDMLGKLGTALERTRIGVFVARLTGKKNWAEGFRRWSETLRREVVFLWSEKLPVMIGDILLGFVNLLLQAFSLWFVLMRVACIHAALWDVFFAFVAMNFVVYYVPTPGASGSVEGAYALVFSGLTSAPELSLAAVLVWRFATFYLHILFGLSVLLLSSRKSGIVPAGEHKEDSP